MLTSRFSSNVRTWRKGSRLTLESLEGRCLPNTGLRGEALPPLITVGTEDPQGTEDQNEWITVGGGEGNYYILPTDNEGWSVVQPGTNHRTIHVAVDGSSTNSGLTPDDPVTLAKAREMQLERAKDGPTSDWILLRRGDEFQNPGSFNGRGESPQQPVYFGAYGDPALSRPIIYGGLRFLNNHNENLVVRDIETRTTTEGAITFTGRIKNVLLENVVARGRESTFATTQPDLDGRLTPSTGLTIRRSVFLDVDWKTPVNERDAWLASRGSQKSGVYINGVDGVLIEETVSDHEAWIDGFGQNGQRPPGLPSAMESYQARPNQQVPATTGDVTFRDNVGLGVRDEAQTESGGPFERALLFAHGSSNFDAGAEEDAEQYANQQQPSEELEHESNISAGNQQESKPAQFARAMVEHFEKSFSIYEALSVITRAAAFEGDESGWDTRLNWSAQELPDNVAGEESSQAGQPEDSSEAPSMAENSTDGSAEPMGYDVDESMESDEAELTVSYQTQRWATELLRSAEAQATLTAGVAMPNGVVSDEPSQLTLSAARPLNEDVELEMTEHRLVDENGVIVAIFDEGQRFDNSDEPGQAGYVTYETNEVSGIGPYVRYRLTRLQRDPFMDELVAAAAANWARASEDA